MLVCVFVCAFGTRDRGCSEHPVFPAPSVQGGTSRCKPRANRAARTRGHVYRRMGGTGRANARPMTASAIPIVTLSGIDGYRFAPPILRNCVRRDDSNCLSLPRKRAAKRGCLEGRAHRRSEAPRDPWNPAPGTPVIARPASISGSLIPLW